MVGVGIRAIFLGTSDIGIAMLTSMRRIIIAAAVASALVLLAGCSATAVASAPSLRAEPPKTLDAAQTTPEIPAKYTDVAGSGIAFEWVTPDEPGYACDTAGSCSVLEVYAYEDCPGGVDVRAQIIDGTDVADERAGSLDSLAVGEAGFISLGELNGAGTYITVTDVVCS